VGGITNLEQLAQALAAVQARLVQAESRAVGEDARRQLAAVSAQLQQASAQFLTDYPRRMAQLQDRQAEAQKQAQEMQARTAQLRQQLEAAEAARKAAAEAPPPPEEAIDPALGATLRRELLERFGSRAPGTAAAGGVFDTVQGAVDPDIIEYLKRKNAWK
jgi:hypothetical protein